MENDKQKDRFTMFKSPKDHANRFIDWLDNTGRQGFNISLDDINEQFADVFEYSVNGILVATDANSLLKRFEKGASEYASAYIVRPLILFNSDGFKLNARYEVTFIPKNGSEQKSINSVSVKFNHSWKVEQMFQSFNPPLTKDEVKVSGLDVDELSCLRLS